MYLKKIISINHSVPDTSQQAKRRVVITTPPRMLPHHLGHIEGQRTHVDPLQLANQRVAMYRNPMTQTHQLDRIETQRTRAYFDIEAQVQIPDTEVRESAPLYFKALKYPTLIAGAITGALVLHHLVHEFGHLAALLLYAPSSTPFVLGTTSGCLFADCDSTCVNEYLHQEYMNRAFLLYPLNDYTMPNGDILNSFDVHFTSSDNCPQGSGYKLDRNREIKSDSGYSTERIISTQE